MEAEQSLAAAAQVTSFASLVGFYEGTLVFRQADAPPAATFEEVTPAVVDGVGSPGGWHVRA